MFYKKASNTGDGSLLTPFKTELEIIFSSDFQIHLLP